MSDIVEAITPNKKHTRWIKYTAAVAGTGALVYIVYSGVKAYRNHNGALGRLPEALLTVAQGGALARWTRTHGQPPSRVIDVSGANGHTYFPIITDGQMVPSPVVTPDMNPFIRGATPITQSDKLSACYAVLAAHESGSRGTNCYAYNAWGIHWYRVMEPRPAFLSQDAGVPTMFVAFQNWTDAVQYLDTMLQHSYPQARERGANGDLVGFTQALGAGGYATVYRTNPRELVGTAQGLVNRGNIPSGLLTL